MKDLIGKRCDVEFYAGNRVDFGAKVLGATETHIWMEGRYGRCWVNFKEVKQITTSWQQDEPAVQLRGFWRRVWSRA